MKRCSACRETKPIGEFYRARGNADGRDNQCSVCRKATLAAYYTRNKEKVLERSVAWQKANWSRVLANKERLRRRAGIKPKRKFATPEERMAANREWQRAYRERHSDRRAATLASYKERYPERVHTTKSNNKARRRAAPGEVTAKQWKAICLFYGNACGRCRTPSHERPLTIDHYIPIAAGGTNTWDNVWPLCLKCNVRKSAAVPNGRPPHVAVLEALA